MKELEEILDYIKVNAQQRQFFDKNGNRDIYEKFKEDASLSQFHTQIHFFLSKHLPIKNKYKKPIQSTPIPLKSCLKNKQYNKNIQCSKNKIDMNYFSLAKAPKRQKQRDNHVRTILSTYNNQKDKCYKEDEPMEDRGRESTHGGSPERQHPTEHLMEVDSPQESGFVKANRFKRKDPMKVDYFEGVEGFKLSGTNKKLAVNLPQRSEDFSFLNKNKVKFNCVDITYKEYQVDPDELEEQKKYSSKYL